jgi:hypothetical protein
MRSGQWVIAKAAPDGETVAQDTFEWREADLPELAEGQLQVRLRYLSLDPSNRVWLTLEDNYLPALHQGDVMPGYGLAEVEQSRAQGFDPGSLVLGLLAWSERAVVDAAGLFPVQRTDGVPLDAYLSLLGLIGLTAYVGMDVLGVQPGETVLVSAAAGATGSLAGQIAKIRGARVIGTAGGPEKCAYLREQLGFDGAIDYKSADIETELRRLAPDGIDAFYDNVGGDVLDAAMANLAMNARILIAGAIADYTAGLGTRGPSNWDQLLWKRAEVRTMVIFDHLHRAEEALAQIAHWHAEGRLAWRSHVIDGDLRRAPELLQMLFRGENHGKLMLRLVEPTAA